MGGPGQTLQHPTGLRFTWCAVGDMCQVKKGKNYQWSAQKDLLHRPPLILNPNIDKKCTVDTTTSESILTTLKVLVSTFPVSPV